MIILPILVPIGLVVAEKKIKSGKFSDDNRHKVMTIPHSTLWVKGSSEINIKKTIHTLQSPYMY
jgi:hypothetical protein